MKTILCAVLVGLFSYPAGVEPERDERSPDEASEPLIRRGFGESPIVAWEVSAPDSATHEGLAAEARRLVGSAEIPVPTIRLVRISDPRPFGEEMSRRRAWAVTVPGLKVARRNHKKETTQVNVTLVLSEDDHRLILAYTEPQDLWVLREEGVPPLDIEGPLVHCWTSMGPAPSETEYTVTQVLGALWWLGVNPSTTGQILIRPRVVQLACQFGIRRPGQKVVCWISEGHGTLTRWGRRYSGASYASGRLVVLSDANLSASMGFDFP